MQHVSPVRYRADIDGLRAVSVIGVIAFHLGASVLPGGFAGVDVFFVISGFLITTIIARESDEGRFSFLTFYERRIRRIFPALILVLAATSAAAWVVLLPSDLREFGRVLAWTPAFASNLVLMDDLDYFSPAAHTRALLHTWSLGVEEQFYIVFPWLLIGARRFGWSRWRVVALVAGLSLAGSIGAAALDFSKSFYLLPTRFWELGVGALLALGMPALTPAWRAAAGNGGLALILVSFFLLNETMMVPGWAVIPPVLGAAGLVMGTGSLANRVLALPPMVFIGRISYPMYLWHWPLIAFAVYASGRLPGVLTGGGLLAATILLSWLTLVCVETPVRTRRWLPAWSSLAPAAIVPSLAAVVFGVAVFAGGGVRSRLSPEDRSFLAAHTASPLEGLVCEGASSSRSSDFASCILGDAKVGRPSFAVLGDSHAWAMASGISRAAETYGVRGLYLGRVGCNLMWGVDRFDGVRRNCAARLMSAVDRVVAEDIGTVILIARWAAMLPPTREDTGAPPINATRVAIEGHLVRPEDLEALVRQRLAMTLDKLAGRRVVLLAGLPEASFHVPQVILRSRYFPIGLPEPITRRQHDARQAPFRAVLKDILAGRQGIEILEPADLMCATGVCLYRLDGKVLYRDDDHLSAAGGEWVAALLNPVFSQLAEPRKSSGSCNERPFGSELLTPC